MTREQKLENEWRAAYRHGVRAFNAPEVAQQPFRPVLDAVFDIPIPPSVNRTRKVNWPGHREMKAWRKEAAYALVLNGQFRERPRDLDRYELAIVLDRDRCRLDPDNIKAVSDFLKSINVIVDDGPQHCEAIHITWGEAPAGCRLVVKPIGGGRMTAPWPHAMESDLRGCVDGGLSSGMTAVKLGLTRSAVIGKARRLGLQWRNAPFNRGGATVKKIEAKARQTRPKKAPVRSFYGAIGPAQAPTDAPRAIPPAPNSKPVDLMGLNNETCHWPLWDEPYEPRLYCGALEADVDGGRSYCWFHASAARG